MKRLSEEHKNNIKLAHKGMKKPWVSIRNTKIKIRG